MTFLEHLDELRRRIMHSIIAVVVTFTVAWIFREAIFGFLEEPIKGVVEHLVVIKPTDPFTIYLKVSFTAAIFLAIPFILFQVWLFVAPGLYRKEKRYVMPFLLASTVLFLLGGMFAYYVILPPALNFLLVEFGKEFQPMITAMDYFDFELLIILGMGAIFQLPVLVAFLSIFGLVTPKFLWKNFRYAFLIITIIAAVVSPTTDPFNLFLWSGPMVILYVLSIGIAWIFKKRREREAADA
ncbi:MAG: twin-arginine translocase subunit TatC [Acidobacteriota bacterium]